MQVVKRDARGLEVERWQTFVLGQGFSPGEIDGLFGPKTADATRRFQHAHGLADDGIVGLKTLGKAMALGFDVLGGDDEADDHTGPSWPQPPRFQPLAGTAARQAAFGAFEYVPAPLPSNPEHIQILGSWVADNIVTVVVPQLSFVSGAPKNGAVQFHRKGAQQLAALFAAWERRGLLGHVLTWGGSFAPRFIRGSKTTLSNHALGTAFDINAAWNALGARPALVGETGSVRELIAIANEHGFWWGGHFATRPDGMHLEALAVPGMLPAALPIELPSRLALPERPAGAPTGTQFLEATKTLSRAEREKDVLETVLAGNVPEFLRTFRNVTVGMLDDGDRLVTGVVRVLPDYLAVGLDEDFVRMPMTPATAEAIAQACDCMLPTKKLVDLIWALAAVKLAPQPLAASPAMMSNAYIAKHHVHIEAQRAGLPVGEMTAGHKKDLVITNRLRWKPGRVAIYGWHLANGSPIQPLSTKHEDTYVDYSHGVRLVAGVMLVADDVVAVRDVLRDPTRSDLLSDEGPIPIATSVA